MRYLSDLVGKDIDRRCLTQGWEQVDITGITADSRAVKKGYLFAAIPGVKQDGRDYIAQAVQNGAAAILTSDLREGEEMPRVPVLCSRNPRHSLAVLAARFYSPQPKWIAAVTGTDGKTSTAHFFQQLWRLMGQPAASIGTLGVVAPDNLPDYPAVNTTPDPILLQQTLYQLARDGVQHVAVEASSHGLDQHRLDGVHIRVGGFTNLSRDHLDYHQTEEHYFNAKLRLFSEVMEGGSVAVLNADDARFAELKKACTARGHKVMSYGKQGETLKLTMLRPYATGQHANVEIQGRKMEWDIPLIGGFQAMNILCAVGMALACGADESAIASEIALLKGVPGRMELAATHPSGAPVFVDYAHTPGGLESVLQHIRPHVSGKVTVVFGCGGDRDKGKRPVMGEIASRLAENVIITDDNPRSEDAATIRAEVASGSRSAREIAGREKAISEAVRGLEKGDALIIAGKGHELTQIIGDVTYPFSDVEVARKAVALI